MSTRSTNPWSSLGRADPLELIEARSQMHQAVQLPAAFGQGLVEPRDDFSHQALTWAHPDWPLSDASAGWRAGLRIADLTLELRDGEGAVRARCDLVGRSLSDGISWLASAVTDAMGSAAGARLELPGFELPAHAVGEEARFDPPARGLSELGALYAAAAEALSELGGSLGAADVRCWPHHFDIAALVEVRRRPRTARPVRSASA